VDIMIVALLIMAAVVVGAPIGAAVLVSISSRREDRAWTLAESAPSRGQATARRILGVRWHGIDWQQITGDPRTGRAWPAGPARDDGAPPDRADAPHRPPVPASR
jgi:hypothetical protein